MYVKHYIDAIVRTPTHKGPV